MKTKLNLLVVGLFLAVTSGALAQPVITTQPTNQFVNASTSVQFRVAASGTGTLTYQWLFNGTAKAGATSSLLSVANAQPTNSGYYSVIVTNASGCVTSQVAELKVFVAAPHSLSGIQVESDRFVSLSFAGETTASFAPYYDFYPLETSSNLMDWAPLATPQRSNTTLDTLSFLDTNAPAFSQRFYRKPTNQLATPDPQPTGPYAVVTFSMLLTNVNRTNAMFMVTFWYPSVAQAGVIPAKYVEPQVAASNIFYNFSSSGGGNFSIQAAAFFSHSLSNTPLATNQATYPVVLYDPGAYCHRRDNTDKAEDLASWGYVVVGLDTSDTMVSVYPDGRVVYHPYPNQQSNNDAIENRLLDLQFVLDELASLNAGDPRLGGRLDLDKIGAFGCSLGGATVAQLCLRDPRCKAGVGFDGPYNETNVLTQQSSVPWLFLRSGVGPDPDPGLGGYLPDGRPDDRLEFYNEALTNAYWVKLASTVHGSFIDSDLIVDSASMNARWGSPMSGQLLPPCRVSQIIRAYMLSFFNKHLKGEDDHLLDGLSPAYPEVLQFLCKSGIAVPSAYPTAALVQDSDGNFYGTTEYGGANNLGTVFQMTPAGMLTTLVSFSGTNGAALYGALVQGDDGNFYGTTSAGGTNNWGTVFQVTPTGGLTTLVSFSGTNGSFPYGGLVQGTDGNFYGTTASGGGYNIGTVFQMTSAGVLTTLYSFYNTAYGADPLSVLVQGANGSFYGTASRGGANGYGTVFKITSAGAFTLLASFAGANGGAPGAGLVQGSDGNFYGTTAYGGNVSLNAGYGFGTVFKMTPAGALTRLASFNGTNGIYSSAKVVQGGDGNFYGTTDGGGAGGAGTVFKMTPTGVFTTLVSLNGTNGINPQGGLMLGADGNFYGTTEYGGTNRLGTVFQVTTNGTLTTLVSFGAQTNSSNATIPPHE